MGQIVIGVARKPKVPMMECAPMDNSTLTDARPYAAAVLGIALMAGCTSAPAECGGQVRPEKLGPDASRILERARADSRAFCSESTSGCDFVVYRTPQGWAVAATKMMVEDGKCVTRFGDDRYFSYDASGTLLKVINGI